MYKRFFLNCNITNMHTFKVKCSVFYSESILNSSNLIKVHRLRLFDALKFMLRYSIFSYEIKTYIVLTFFRLIYFSFHKQNFSLIQTLTLINQINLRLIRASLKKFRKKFLLQSLIKRDR